ncbi:putative PurR-regulated permease PerM [Beijerinckiaceae bacterium RH AL1]|nr:AI-2E family transporter [Beijerinckiaceae bacterium]VVB44603.1 putative PurR-regulated permease PerM [Beijerinckiaceae bacterium RH CH11]VVB44681.1 putative PurR-regulated permease PerM [Beijerinckiaceae bacterium RH AL8]VVC54441.1 putative PurR-regulated permease PerM [Beijerinckiaceae bacterium RH AL1]
MTVLLPGRERRTPAPPPDPAHTLDTLATILITVVTVAVLYLAREILVPIAIAILLSFVLSPLVKALRKLGINKKVAVGLVVLSAFCVAVGLGAVLGKQISDLAAEAPRYQVTVSSKMEGLRDFATRNPIIGKLNDVIASVSHMTPQQGAPQPQAQPQGQDRQAQATRQRGQPSSLGEGKPKVPVPVEIVTPPPGVLTILQEYAGTAASPLATAAFVAIFIVFILMQREDLRNRFIRLVSYGDLQRTTLAMSDAADRLSRYLLAQVLLNVSFGIVVGGALAIIGVPSALMWGIIAVLMRFIPYIGAIGAAAGPLIMASVAGAGWSLAIETLILFVTLETIVGQLVEPLVYGSRTGISPIAVVASATFWTWLWGPVGLVLATPLTVCLVVMGRHVERFGFLDVLLGDEPALTPVESFYQRMLAGDLSEIADHAELFLRDRPLIDYCDEVVMPTLLLAQADVRRGVLEEERQSRIRDTMHSLVEDIVDEGSSEADEDAEGNLAATGEAPPTAADEPDIEIAPEWRTEGAVLCLAGRTPLDEAAAMLLALLLQRRGLGVRVASAETLAQPDETAPRWPEAKLILLSFLDADLRLAQARFAIRRLRRRAPDAPIAAAFWMSEPDEGRANELCANVRAETCVASLPQAIALCLDRAGVPHDDIGSAAPKDEPALALKD